MAVYGEKKSDDKSDRTPQGSHKKTTTIMLTLLSRKDGIRMNQRKRVLDYMRTHDGITSMDAYDLGITQLATRIFELKKEGVNIQKERINITNRYGEHSHYDRYYLGELA